MMDKAKWALKTPCILRKIPEILKALQQFRLSSHQMWEAVAINFNETFEIWENQEMSLEIFSASKSMERG